MYTLYRDDDISVTSDINLLMKVHDLFIKHNKIHTVAVVVKDIWDNKEVWYWLMTAPNLRMGFHGWEHHDYSKRSAQDIHDDIKRSVDYIWEHAVRGRYQAKLDFTFFPPWNRVSSDLEKVCNQMGFVLDSRIGGDVFNFHYWACQDKKHMDELERALTQ